MIQAGRLRHRVTLQQLGGGSPSQNLGGELEETWGDAATVWAAIEPLRGRELFAAQQVDSEVTGTIRIRYRDGVVSKMRVVFGTRYYDILSVTDPNEQHRELLLYVREGLSDG